MNPPPSKPTSAPRPPLPDVLASALRSPSPALAFAAATAFAFSLIWLWSSGYKDGVTFAGLGYVLFQAFRRRERISCGGLGWPILAYVVVCAISSWTSMDTNLSWRAYWKLLELVAGFIALANLLRPGRRSDFAALAIASAMILAAAADSLRFAADATYGTRFLTDGRWSGSRYGFPTIAAAVHAVGLVLSAAMLLRAAKPFHRLLGVAGLALTGWLLLGFQTRSVLLGIGAGFGVLIVAASRNRRPALVALSLCSAALAVALVASPGFRTRILSGSFSDRAGIWRDAVQVIKFEPKAGKYFGIGYGHGIFLKIQKRMPKGLRSAKHVYNHTHNMVLETLVETGWPGFIAWFALLGTAAWRFVGALRRAGDERRWTLAAPAAALVVLLVYGQFSAFFALAPIFLFWNLLGVLAAAWSPGPGPAPVERNGP